MPVFRLLGTKFEVSEQQLQRAPESLLAEIAKLTPAPDYFSGEVPDYITVSSWPKPHLGVFEGVVGCLTGDRPVPAEGVTRALLHEALIYINIPGSLWPKGLLFADLLHQKRSHDMAKAQELLDLIYDKMGPEPFPTDGSNAYEIQHELFLYKGTGGLLELHDEPLLLQKRPWSRACDEEEEPQPQPWAFEYKAAAQQLAAGEHLSLEFTNRLYLSWAWCKLTVTLRNEQSSDEDDEDEEHCH